MTLRVTFLIIALVAAYGFLAFHLSELQLAKNDYYTARAQSEQLALQDTTRNRGAIYFTDKSGTTLPAAVNQDFPIIYAVPSAIEDSQETANRLAPILGMPVAKLEGILSRPNDPYELLARKADATVAQAVAALDIKKGVIVDTEPDRFYPLGAVASQVLGFVGPNASDAGESGHYGIEQFYNGTLDGTAPSGDSAGFIAGSGGTPGADLILTIDPNIQIRAEKILDELVAKSGATGGSVIVLDPQTGRILAMGGMPGFDPNYYASSSFADFLNTNVESQYEPGSIFKVITMAAGIDAGKITPMTTYTDTGSVTFGKAKITNYDLTTHGPYGSGTTMTNVIEHSINTGAVFAEQKTGNATFLSYLKNFGFDDKSGIDLPGEIKSNISELTPHAPQVAYATAAYGQGVAVTPIALIDAIAAIANGGTLMRPYLDAALKPQAVRRVVSEDTAAKVTAMMVSAVDKAKVANIEGYSLAGKTGSAFIPDLVHGGYTDKLIDSYVGFGPTSNPRFIALIRLNTLPSTALAAESVVPAWRDLAQYIINYYNIPPDRLAAGQ
jgi:cell division protein FtsI/penicillin-binding protein 2